MNLEQILIRLRSWQTTVVGFLGGLAMVAVQLQYALDSDPQTVFDKAVLVTGLTLMGLGFFAKDGNKSTEDVGRG